MNTSSFSSAAAFAQNGFIIVNVFSPAEAAALKDEAKALLARHGAPGASVWVGASMVSQIFYAAGEDPRLLAALSPLMPDGVAFLSDKVVAKDTRRRFATPWHADRAYWAGTRPKISVWLALDPVDADNGALTVVPGSHRRDWAHAHRSDGFANGEFANALQADWDPSEVVTATVGPGDAVIFSDRLVHGSTASTNGRDRFTIISTYQSPLPEEPFDLPFSARRCLVPAASATAV